MSARTIHSLLIKFKYEILLAALLIHLYFGIFILENSPYLRYVWTASILLLGLASVSVFSEKGRWRKRVRNILFAAMILLPSVREFLNENNFFLVVYSLVYAGFFAVIFVEVLRFLTKPSYINKDLITAATCGYFLLLEILVFLMLTLYSINQNSFNNIDTSSPVAVFIDLAYYGSITFSTIGYGDITPATQNSKLLVSFFGVISQFYMVVLIGLLISKFTSRKEQ